MALIKLVSEEEAPEPTKQIYDEIKAHYNLKFVPKLFQAWAAQPERLQNRWSITLNTEEKLGKENFHIIGLSTALSTGCNYCVNFHSRILQDEGYSDQDLGFLVETISSMVSSDLFAQAMQLKPDVIPTIERFEAA